MHLRPTVTVGHEYRVWVCRRYHQVCRFEWPVRFVVAPGLRHVCGPEDLAIEGGFGNSGRVIGVIQILVAISILLYFNSMRNPLCQRRVAEQLSTGTVRIEAD